MILFLSLVFFLFVVFYFNALRILKYDFGYAENVALANDINRILFDFSPNLSSVTPYCKVNKLEPWRRNKCVMVKPALERNCGFWTKGTSCLAVQVPLEYGKDEAFMKAVFDSIVEALRERQQYTYLLVQDSKTINVIVRKDENGHTTYHASKIRRSATYKISKTSKELNKVKGEEFKCYGNKISCAFDRDADLTRYN